MGFFDAPRTSDCFSVPSLDYTRTQPGPSVNTCLIISLALVVWYVMQLSSPRHAYPMMANGITTMVAQVEKALGVSEACIDAHKVFPEVPANTIQLADSKNVEKNAGAYQTATPEEKKACENNARQWMAAESRAIVMIFAHWCPHCKSTIPSLVETTKKLKCKTLMINADALPPSAFVGENAIHDLKYFPTILTKAGDTVKQVNSMEEVEAELEAPEESAAAAEVPAEAEVVAAESPAAEAVEEEEDTTEMLAKLF